MKQFLYISCAIILFLSGCDKADVSGGSASGGDATNGSTSRFVVVGDYMYAISKDALNVYDISTPSSPVFKSTEYIGFAIQTILPYKDKLFIGSNNAMFIYSLSNPEKPSKLSQVPYFIMGRDPIIALDSVAYSTIINPVTSAGTLNIFNIKDISQPVNVGSIPMTSPYGLGIKDNALYVCEATKGLAVFNITNAYAPERTKTVFLDEAPYDVIVDDNTLVCYISGGVAFFDISDIYNPLLISKVKN